ncbi:MAG: rane protein [Solirubrobacteraceae bacterium]|jgi:membrane protein|nr:rane protein [Solirubrobacteraceae bacterium]
MQRLRRIAEELRALTLREAVREVLRGSREHDLLVFASAIAFHVLFAIIPLVLFGLGLLGGLGLEEQWTSEWAPSVRESMSPSAFQVVDDTVRRALGEQQVFWMTAGAVLAVWRISSTMRTIMEVFDRIYASRRRRSFAERMRVSLLLGAAVAGLLLAAAGCVVLGDDALRSAGIDSGLILWLRWPLGLMLLFAVVALLVAYAPADRQPAQWVTFGSIVVVAAWAGTSLVLGTYLTSIADYGSIFAALATVVVALAYVYLASAAVLVGAQLDAVVRERVGERS